MYPTVITENSLLFDEAAVDGNVIQALHVMDKMGVRIRSILKRRGSHQATDRDFRRMYILGIVNNDRTFTTVGKKVVELLDAPNLHGMSAAKTVALLRMRRSANRGCSLTRVSIPACKALVEDGYATASGYSTGPRGRATEYVITETGRNFLAALAKL